MRDCHARCVRVGNPGDEVQEVSLGEQRHSTNNTASLEKVCNVKLYQYYYPMRIAEGLDGSVANGYSLIFFYLQSTEF